MERRKSVTSTSQNIPITITPREKYVPTPSPYIFRILRITYIGRHLVLTSLHITSFTMTFLEYLSQTKYKNTLMYWSDFWLGQIVRAFGNLKGYRKLVPMETHQSMVMPQFTVSSAFPGVTTRYGFKTSVRHDISRV